MPDCPYAGLMPFTEEQADFFFGREAEREIITANLMASRLKVVPKNQWQAPAREAANVQ